MKRLIKILLLIILISPSYKVNASTETFKRDEINNYGVNKKWEITDKNINNVKNTPLVDASEKIYDFADILTDEEEKELYNYVQQYIKTTNMDMVILTIDMPYYRDEQNEEYAADFYDYNDFGIDIDKYSGVLLLRNNYINDRYFNVYMFGEAQLYYDYDRSEEMLDLIYPDFVNKNYLDGYKKFIDSYTNYYNVGIPHSNKHYYIDDMGYMQKEYVPPIVIAFLISSIITFITMSILISKNKMIKSSTNADQYLLNNTINYTKRENTLINSFVTSHTITSDSSSGGGGHHSSSSGSSGGGHSSGGGRHG